MLELMEKSPALPAVWLMIARRDPLESLTTVALRPRLFPLLSLAELMAVARSLRLFTPLPVETEGEAVRLVPNTLEKLQP